MAASSVSSKSCAHLEAQLPNNSSIESTQVSATHNSQWLQHTGKASLSNRLRGRYAKTGAIYPLKVCTTLGFCSRLFLVPKHGKKWRPVIDLSVLNRFLHVPTFKTETAEIIRNSLTKGEWLVSIDLHTFTSPYIRSHNTCFVSMYTSKRTSSKLFLSVWRQHPWSSRESYKK